ncbi:MAG: hypothetical protein JXD18_00865, partial [Anaerolineae bacterium]|nr:hypothetical protein [Anaerolineae bacterium]
EDTLTRTNYAGENRGAALTLLKKAFNHKEHKGHKEKCEGIARDCPKNSTKNLHSLRVHDPRRRRVTDPAGAYCRRRLHEP